MRAALHGPDGSRVLMALANDQPPITFATDHPRYSSNNSYRRCLHYQVCFWYIRYIIRYTIRYVIRYIISRGDKRI